MGKTREAGRGQDSVSNLKAVFLRIVNGLLNPLSNVEKAGEKMFRATAEMQFRQFGVRSIVWEFHPSRSGGKLYTWWIVIYIWLPADITNG